MTERSKMRRGGLRVELVGFGFLILVCTVLIGVNPTWLSSSLGGPAWVWTLGLLSFGIVAWFVYKRIVAPPRRWISESLARHPDARAVTVLPTEEKSSYTGVLIPSSEALILSTPDTPEWSISWHTITRIDSRVEPLGVLKIIDVFGASGSTELSFYLLSNDAVSMAQAPTTDDYVAVLQRAQAAHIDS